MKICIMATNENVAQVRAKAYESLPQLRDHQLLGFPASADGKEPITHWLCQLEATEELRDKLMSLKEISEMEVMGLKDFLESKNIQIVRRK